MQNQVKKLDRNDSRIYYYI